MFLLSYEYGQNLFLVNKFIIFYKNNFIGIINDRNSSNSHIDQYFNVISAPRTEFAGNNSPQVSNPLADFPFKSKFLNWETQVN